MSNSFEKSIGIILLILLAVILVPVLGILPFFGMHGTSFMRGPAELFLFFPLIIMAFLWVMIAVWVYRDAESRGMSGMLWALLVFFGNVLGLIVYMIVRSGSFSNISTAQKFTTPKACPSCNRPTQHDFIACPHCGTALQRKCANCGKSLAMDWKNCPYCGQAAERVNDL